MKKIAKMGIEADKPAEIGDQPRMAALVEHADQKEERPPW